MTVISAFSGEYGWLSNFWPAKVMYQNCVFPSVEHAYVAAKARHFTDNLGAKIGRMTAGEAKRYGRYIPLRPDWEEVKINVMLDLVRQKFQIPELREKLLATGDATLVEGNTWGDRFWGVCRGEGENYLGKILMMVRSECRDEESRVQSRE